jgi:hypothetical protein
VAVRRGTATSEAILKRLQNLGPAKGAIELRQWLARKPTMFKPKAGKRFVIWMPNDRE